MKNINIFSNNKESPSQGNISIVSYFLIFVKLISILLIGLLLSLPTHATIDEDTLDMFSENGIYYYNPTGNPNCASTSTTLKGDNTAEKIWNFFIEQGFNDAQVAGILGNTQAESNMGPTRSSSGSYWGIFQWGGGRKDNVQARISEAGLGQYLSSEYWPSGADANIPAADFDRLIQIELEYAMSEQDYDWQSELKTANTPEEAAEIFLTLFERAVNGDSPILYYAPFVGLSYQGTAKRRDYAVSYYALYAGNGTSTSYDSPTLSDGSNVTIIGDSITEGSTAALLQKFSGLTLEQINAVTSRTFSEGITIAESIPLNDIIVFALGSNSPNITVAELNRLISLIGTNHRLILVTNYGTADYSSNNELFKNTAVQHQNISIANWHSAVASNPTAYLQEDRVHPNGDGQMLFAETIYNAINDNTHDNGCSITGEFNSLVLSYAWPDYHSAQFIERMPAYAQAVTLSQASGRYVGGSVRGVPGIDCGGFVTILTQNSGLEPTYNMTSSGAPAGNTYYQEKWVIDNGWTLINSSNTTPIDTSLLQAGDIAFSGGTSYLNNGHTFIYVGDIPGFNSTIASASYSTDGTGGRAPMAGKEDLIKEYTGSIVRWYRKN